jgi:hypothetical protein
MLERNPVRTQEFQYFQHTTNNNTHHDARCTYGAHEGSTAFTESENSTCTRLICLLLLLLLLLLFKTFMSSIS